MKTNQRVQMTRANGETQEAILIECITDHKRAIDIINSNTNNQTHQWRVKIIGSEIEDVWSERRMSLI